MEQDNIKNINLENKEEEGQNMDDYEDEKCELMEEGDYDELIELDPNEKNFDQEYDDNFDEQEFFDNYDIQIGENPDLDHIDEEMEEDLTPIKNQEFPDFQADGEIYSIGLNEKLGLLIIGDGEENLFFYDLVNKKLVNKFKDFKDSIISIKFSPEINNKKEYLAIASIDGTVNNYQLKTNENGLPFYDKLFKLDSVDSEINFIKWHNTVPVYAFGTADGTIYIQHATNLNKKMYFYGHENSVTCAEFTPDGKFLISGSEDASVRIWHLKNQKCEAVLSGYKFHEFGITALALSKNGLVATGSMGNEICIANYENSKILYKYKVGEDNFSIESLCFCNNDKFLVFGGSEGNIQIIDLTNNFGLRSKIALKNENLTKIIKSKKDEFILYFTTSSGYFYKFDVRGQGSFIQEEKLHKDVILEFELTDDENFVVTSCLDGTINMVKIL